MQAESPSSNSQSDETVVDCLPPDQWTPAKPAVSCVSSSSGYNASGCSSPRADTRKRALSYEEVVQHTEECIKNLLQRSDFTSAEARPHLKFLQRQTRYASDLFLSRRVTEVLVKQGIAHVFLKVWRNVSTLDVLSPHQQATFKNLQTMLSIVWNCCDKSVALCEALARGGAIQQFFTELKSDSLKYSALENENELYLVKAYMGILHNIVRLSADSRRIFRMANAVNILQAYLHSSKSIVKTKAYLILSYIINEDENDIINATDDNIRFLVYILREALSSENHFSVTHAFWAGEIACGLNHLAINDLNKLLIVRQGALPLYVRLLESPNIEEQSLGTAGLWILAFADENKLLIREEPRCIAALQSLSEDGSEESVRRAARGALWVMRSAPTPLSSPQATPSAGAGAETAADASHVMLSYNWASLPIMRQIHGRLTQAGYKVWMDVEQMSGSTLEAMALAVERAAVMLIAMSQAYKDSPSCRTEAEYAYRQRVPVIPLLLQAGYVPDGWLGALVGTRLYFDFTNDQQTEVQTARLLREIGDRGKLPSPETPANNRLSGGALGRDFADAPNTSLNARASGDIPYARASSHEALASSGASCARASSQDASCCARESRISLYSSQTSLHSYQRQPSSLDTVSAWGVEEVQAWCERHGVPSAADGLAGFSRDLLLQYKRMMESAPEHFYSTLEKHLHLGLADQLRFAHALEHIH